MCIRDRDTRAKLLLFCRFRCRHRRRCLISHWRHTSIPLSRQSHGAIGYSSTQSHAQSKHKPIGSRSKPHVSSTSPVHTSHFSSIFLVKRQVALNLNKNNSPWIGINMLCNVFFTEEAFHEASEIVKITAALQQILWRIVREERQICRSFYATEGHVQLVLLGDTASMEAKALRNCSV